MIEKGLKFAIETKENTAFLITKNGLKTKKIEHHISEYIVIRITNNEVTCMNVLNGSEQFTCTKYYLEWNFKNNPSWVEVK